MERLRPLLYTQKTLYKSEKMMLFCFKISIRIISIPWIFPWWFLFLYSSTQVSFLSDLPHPSFETAYPFHSHPVLYPLQVKNKFFFFNRKKLQQIKETTPNIKMCISYKQGNSIITQYIHQNREINCDTTPLSDPLQIAMIVPIKKKKRALGDHVLFVSLLCFWSSFSGFPGLL